VFEMMMNSCLHATFTFDWADVQDGIQLGHPVAGVV